MTTVLQLKNLLGTAMAAMHRLFRCVATAPGLWACNACDGVVVGLGLASACVCLAETWSVDHQLVPDQSYRSFAP
ncbi:hypothetical protein B0H14DRAFT_2939909 [Mycena olivaceomarginata]|nr:hypothetical protein B0H14DRAFT_2939909 [Mycena olivaceomarginata]